jgi:hypothetical protein
MTSEHVRSIHKPSALEIQPVCSCGWKGIVRHLMSDDYAFTNASDDWNQHAGLPRYRRRGYLGSTPDGGIDDGP